MKISTVGNGQARWMSTRTAVRETLYEAKRSMTIEELVEETEGAASTIRSHLADLVWDGRVVRIEDHPVRYIHSFWAKQRT